MQALHWQPITSLESLQSEKTRLSKRKRARVRIISAELSGWRLSWQRFSFFFAGLVGSLFFPKMERSVHQLHLGPPPISLPSPLPPPSSPSWEHKYDMVITAQPLEKSLESLVKSVRLSGSFLPSVGIVNVHSPCASDRLHGHVPLDCLRRPREIGWKIMSIMFGKVKTYNSAAAPDQSPADCNLVLLGVMGSGKSGPTFLYFFTYICLGRTTYKQKNPSFLR